jgi:hypothetical protein
MPIMINMIAANVIQPTAALLLSSDMLPRSFGASRTALHGATPDWIGQSWIGTSPKTGETW